MLYLVLLCAVLGSLGSVDLILKDSRTWKVTVTVTVTETKILGYKASPYDTVYQYKGDGNGKGDGDGNGGDGNGNGNRNKNTLI